MIGTVQKQIKIDEKRSQMRDEFVRKIKQIETKKEKEQKLMEKERARREEEMKFKL